MRWCLVDNVGTYSTANCVSVKLYTVVVIGPVGEKLVHMGYSTATLQKF
jgi:hypothetical protein